jgi:hypothetical protein
MMFCRDGSRQDRRPRSAGGTTGRDLDRFATSVQRAPSICIHHAHQGVHLVKDAISQEIPSTLPLVQGRAKHVRRTIADRTLLEPISVSVERSRYGHRGLAPTRPVIDPPT